MLQQWMLTQRLSGQRVKVASALISHEWEILILQAGASTALSFVWSLGGACTALLLSSDLLSCLHKAVKVLNNAINVI